MPKKKTTNKTDFVNKFKNANIDFAEVGNLLEKELSKALRTARKQSTHSKEKVMKNIDDLMDKVGASELKDKAIKKTDAFTRELLKASKEFVDNFKSMDIELEDSLENIKDGVTERLQDAVDQMQGSEFFEFAKGKFSDTKNQVFTVFNIPSQADVDRLARRVVSLEKKLKTLSNKRAR